MPVATLEDSPETTEELTRPDRHEKGTYGQILKSSALVGGSQIFNIVFGMVRTKAMALMLGPAGFGLFGLYNSVAQLAQTLAGLGINSSGVRQIAAAAGTGNGERIANTISVLRKVAVLLGLLGAALMILFSREISLATFATERRSGAICWLSIAVFLSLISGAQTALIQGMRRIADLARMQVLAAVFGTLCGIPLIYIFRERGVVPSLISIAATTIIASSWYSSKIDIPPGIKDQTHSSRKQALSEVAALLKLGLAFMTSSVITLGVAYLIRITVMRKVGAEATGLYQSAWTMGGLYVGFILQAMAADFYPRLTAAADDNVVCNRLVNEQARVGLLLAGPGVIASLTFAPVVVALFYSSKFGASVGILRWICLGTILQVITWPMGFIIVAKAKRTLFVGCEVAWGIVSVALAWVCISSFGLTGAGISFFGSYIFHGLMLYAVVHRTSGFRWSRENAETCLISLSLVGAAFGGFYIFPLAYGVMVGTTALLINTVYSVRTITTFIPPEQIPHRICKVLSALGLMPRTTTAAA